MTRIQIEIEFKHVNTWLAQKAELASFGVLFHLSRDLRFTDASLPRDAGNLKLRCCRRDVRVEPRSGGGDKVHGDWRPWVFRAEFLGITLYPIQELMICRA